MKTKSENKLLYHLKELRKRILYCTITIAVIFSFLLLFSDPIFNFMALPLLSYLPVDNPMIATSITSTLLVPMKLSLYLAILITMPFILYQSWKFIAPALYSKEKKVAWLLLFFSCCLFYLGILFAYFIVFPILFNFFVSIAPDSVQVMPDISQYLSFIMKLFFAFGLSFETPILIILLVLSELTTPKELSKKRPYIIVAAFTAAMLLTPPDVLSQILLAIPLCLMFELGIIIARVMSSKRNRDNLVGVKNERN